MKMKPLLITLALLAGLACSSYAQTTEPSKEAGTGVLQNVTFKDVEVKDAIKQIGRTLKVNVVFDESVRVQLKLNIELQDVTLEAALKIIFIQQKLRASWIEERTIIVYSDYQQARERFQEFKVWEPKNKLSK
ncbi:MAG: hypothetical protein HYR56_21680 [Acidobacteria bacterium]|nr:hypothetical protein [Acidobacteriota bacterium]MBI3423812.1 hypothetical protein [Acidobacteriota bacterium]